MKNKKVKVFVKISITVSLVFIIVYKIDICTIIQNFKGYSVGYFVTAFVVSLIVNLIGSFSLHAVYPKEKVLDIFKVTLKSNFYAMALPGQLLGETTKIFLLSKEQSSLSERVSAVVIDKFLNAIAMIIVGGIGLFLSPNMQEVILQRCLFAGFAIMVLGLLALKNEKLLHLLEKNIDRVIKNEKWLRKSEECLNTWSNYSNKNRELIISGILGIVYQLVIAVTYYVIGLGLGIEVSFWDYCWINAMLTLILFLPVSIGGLGVREATLIGFLGELNINAEKAVTLSVLMLGIQLLRAAIGGLLLLCEQRDSSYERKANDKL